MGEPTDLIESTVETLLVEALAASVTRRMAERIVGDLRRIRGGALPSDASGLLALVRGDLTRAAFLRIGLRARTVVTDVEERVLALSSVPMDAWTRPRLRLLFVGRNASAAEHLARAIGAQPVVVRELHELLIGLDTDLRTLVLVDDADTALEAHVVARFAPDFPAHVLTFVASSSPATREAFLSTGAAFRTHLRSEPMDHPDLPCMLRELLSGVSERGPRRTRDSTSTTTDPRRAA